jgi:hypothetical protein
MHPSRCGYTLRNVEKFRHAEGLLQEAPIAVGGIEIAPTISVMSWSTLSKAVAKAVTTKRSDMSSSSMTRLSRIAVAVAYLGSGAMSVGVAAPSNGYYEFRGALIITGIDVVTPASPKCASLGYSVGSEYNIRFTPPGSTLGNNGTNWRLSIFWREHAESFVFATAPTATFAAPTSNMTIGRGFGAFTVTPQVAIGKQTPNPVATTTTTVYLEGKIRNFGNEAKTTLSEGCDISFRASGVLKP